MTATMQSESRGPGSAGPWVLLGLLAACSAWPGAAAAAKPASAPGDDARRREVLALKLQAAGRDAGKADEALAKLEAMGLPARPALREVLAAMLAANRRAIESAARAAQRGDRARADEKKLAELRAEARAHIAKLTKDDDSIKKAAGFYKKLLPATKRSAATLAARSRLLDAAVRRIDLLKRRRRVEGRVGPYARPGDERGPIDLAARTLGASLANFKGLADLAEQAELKGLFAFRRNRRIQSHNRKLARWLDASEARNVVLVNAYREALGLLRLEVDKRLVRSARAHSREMVELGYFSHTSPTPENKDFAARMKKAGYPHPGGENLALGTRTALHTFEQWFKSPGHHRNMVRPRFTTIGVGKFGKHWTQNFGTGKRQALADEPAGPTRPSRSKGPKGRAEFSRGR